MDPDGSSELAASGLQRIIADTFVLRFRTEFLLWNAVGDTPDRTYLLRSLISLLNYLLEIAAVRLKIVGGSPPEGLERLRKLASFGDTAGVGDLRDLALGYAVAATDFQRLATIVRANGDEVTAHMLLSQVGRLEEAAYRVARAVE